MQPVSSSILNSSAPNSSLLRHVGFVALPEHVASGGFDHAAVHAASGHVYVAHTANSAVDVFDPASHKHLYSVPHLPGVAGVLVSDEAQLIITSNRAENTIGVFAPGPDPQVAKVAVGVRPNGLAFDHVRRQILAANVGDPAIAASHTLTVVALDEMAVRAEIPVAGRTRWAVFDRDAQVFYVNIADPPEIVVVDARQADNVARNYAIPTAGPHGLDLDPDTHRLFCACDSAELITLDARSGRILGTMPLSGSPDVVFFDRAHQRLYVAVGEPGTIDVFDTQSMARLGTVATERGSHTFALAPAGDRIYAFLPASHRAAIYQADRA
jgi:DNA-binding beta-propeller fold protein YncE